MPRTLPYLAGVAVAAALVSSCTTMPPTGAVVSLYQDAMAAAARPPTRPETKLPPRADQATVAVTAWREGGGGAAPQSASSQLQ